MPNSARLLVLAPLVLLLAAGCTKGNRKANATVSGKVTYMGKPVTGGNMTFHAEGFGNTPAYVKPDGSYVGTDLPVDVEVTVTVETETLNSKATPTYGAGRPGAPAGGGTGGPGGANVGGRPVRPPGAETPAGTGGSEVYVKIPSKYAEKTTSTLTKKFSSGSQTWNLELTD